MLLKLLERIDRRRFEPHVFSLTTTGELGARIAELGIPVEALGMRPGVPSPGRFFRLAARLRRLRPDLVHTWMYHADLLGGLAARCAGVRSIVWGIRNSTLDPVSTKWSTRAVVRLCGWLSPWLPTRILSCSEVAVGVHARLGYHSRKMSVIPNGFDLARFRPDFAARASVRADLGVGTDDPLIGVMGRFDPQKNHLGFVKAAALLRKSVPRVQFVLAGARVDPQNTALMDAVAAEGLGDVMHLLGLRQDMARLMAALDVLVLPSVYGEAFPNVVGEAMACGVPCVVTDVGDAGYIVGDTGAVVAPGDVQALVENIAALLSKDRRAYEQLSLAARNRVLTHFEIGRVVGRYEELYEQLVQG
jgi:glycosyltransferase involved in cell wall biosynthesis